MIVLKYTQIENIMNIRAASSTAAIVVDDSRAPNYVQI